MGKLEFIRAVQVHDIFYTACMLIYCRSQELDQRIKEIFEERNMHLLIMERIFVRYKLEAVFVN